MKYKKFLWLGLAATPLVALASVSCAANSNQGNNGESSLTSLTVGYQVAALTNQTFVIDSGSTNVSISDAKTALSHTSTDSDNQLATAMKTLKTYMGETNFTAFRNYTPTTIVANVYTREAVEGTYNALTDTNSQTLAVTLTGTISSITANITFYLAGFKAITTTETANGTAQSTISTLSANTSKVDYTSSLSLTDIYTAINTTNADDATRATYIKNTLLPNIITASSVTDFTAADYANLNLTGIASGQDSVTKSVTIKFSLSSADSTTFKTTIYISKSTASTAS